MSSFKVKSSNVLIGWGLNSISSPIENDSSEHVFNFRHFSFTPLGPTVYYILCYDPSRCSVYAHIHWTIIFIQCQVKHVNYSVYPFSKKMRHFRVIQKGNSHLIPMNFDHGWYASTAAKAGAMELYLGNKIWEGRLLASPFSHIPMASLGFILHHFIKLQRCLQEFMLLGQKCLKNTSFVSRWELTLWAALSNLGSGFFFYMWRLPSA